MGEKGCWWKPNLFWMVPRIIDGNAEISEGVGPRATQHTCHWASAWVSETHWGGWHSLGGYREQQQQGDRPGSVG